MPVYAYRAVHSSGRIAKGAMEAANENELARCLCGSGLELLDVRETTTTGLRVLTFGGRVPARVLAVFFSRLRDLLAAGISFPDALRECESSMGNRLLSEALPQISNAISDGKGLAGSFGFFPRLFQPFYIAMIGAGEKTGDMASVFGFMAEYATRTAESREKLVRALRYPLFLILVAGGAVAFMMTMVVPQLVLFLDGFGEKIPFLTRTLVGFSNIVSDYGLGAFVFLFIATITSSFLRKTLPSLDLFLDRLFLSIPYIGPLILHLHIARFAYSFSLLFQSGRAVSESLSQAKETVQNADLRRRLEGARDSVLEGKSLSLALAGVFPAFALGLLKTGEQTGDLAKSLDRIATFYERDSARALDSLIGLLEPGLTLMVGLFLIWTVSAVLGPLYGSLPVLGG